MKVSLLDPRQDWRDDPTGRPEDDDLVADLGLDTLFDAMAGDDSFLREVCRAVILSPLTDPSVITYRQQCLRDVLEHPAAAQEMYAVAVEAIEAEHRIFPSFVETPQTVLDRAVKVMEVFRERLHALRACTREHANEMSSPGFRRLADMLEEQLDDAWFDAVDDHLRRLRFKGGVLISARLGAGCQGVEHVLRAPREDRRWTEKLPWSGGDSLTYRVPDRDEAGARAVSELRGQGLALAAQILDDSAEHVLGFFRVLRRELAFLLGCATLHARLTAKNEPVCFPRVMPTGDGGLECVGLYDTCLTLRSTGRVVGNDVGAPHAALIVISGANEGGKSTFLRSVGLAQLMAQSGMFVSAVSLNTDVRLRLFTHYRREEDASLESGKLDEELARMSAIADQVSPGSTVLFNESFAATGEREGAELAHGIIDALLESGVKVVTVTHMFDLVHSLREQAVPGTALFLQAEREEDGRRTFRLAAGEPAATGFGEDLYRRVFEAGDQRSADMALPPAPTDRFDDREAKNQ
ncbi:hypothetical protein [Streptomyces sp. NPDC047046]|uniref:MutS-related protein n=1 Tax=Streptomyces sp. NPDC047046 TaxID=3155378 RepID=UPI003405BFC4